jgi:hypothetical protein
MKELSVDLEVIIINLISQIPMSIWLYNDDRTVVASTGGIRAGGEIFCSMRFLASIDHDGRRHPTAAMRPHSRLLSIQQSTKILGNRLVLLN